MIRKRFIPLAMLLGACSIPFAGGPEGDAKAECDQYAAQAIQSPSARDARNLAAQATECYARLAQSQ
jgi:hypothetical protein